MIRHDARGREIIEGNRVRGTYGCGEECHGFVTRFYDTEKYGEVVLIIDANHQEHNIPFDRVRRMYGDTQSIAEAKELQANIAAREAAGAGKKPKKRARRKA